jgi:antitoxin component HigA of HigAB toxin-antitoxin module
MTTEIKPIRTKRDTALREIKGLWGAKASSLEGDRLDALATLIDAYEAEHFPGFLGAVAGVELRLAHPLHPSRQSGSR